MNRSGLLCLAILGCAGDPSGGASPAITVRTVDGVTTVTHAPAALDRVVTVRPGGLLQSIGGLEADEEHDATAMGSGWLLAEGFITLQGREATFRRYDSSGTVVARFGGRGEGPDEFLSLGIRRLTGDSLELLDRDRGTVRHIDGALVAQPGRRLAEMTSRDVSPLAMVDAGLLAVRTDVDTSGAMSGPAFRLPVHLLLHREATNQWDTLLGYRGPLMYPERGNEGGEDYPAQRFVTFGPSPLIAIWRGRIAVVDNSDWTIAVHDPDGALRIRTLAAWPLRPVTPAMREAQVAADLANLARWNAPPQAKALWVTQAREQRFADSVAPYDRMMAARDGALWLRLNITPLDTLEQEWLGFGRDGQLVRRLVLPAPIRLLDIDRDRVLVRRTDNDGIGYIELRRLKGEGP